MNDFDYNPFSPRRDARQARRETIQDICALVVMAGFLGVIAIWGQVAVNYLH